ncbi:DUF2920 family protein, partial [Campylobacter insulaenigrae]|uniref:DUF2920 family protein n=1 Tax=Campylobacter insulaenigrae TaxID=260714 RepID=UPI002152531E
MLINKTYFIDSCDDVELNIKRESKLEYRITYDDEKEMKAVVFVIGGFGVNSNISFLDFDRKFLCKKFDVIVVNVFYHCFCARESINEKYNPSMIPNQEDLSNIQRILNALSINIKANENNFLDLISYINENVKVLKDKGLIDIDQKAILSCGIIPPNNEYQNYGIMAAIDHINALKDILNKYPQFKTLPKIYGGGSYGGYLALMCAKIAPWYVDGVIDNSCVVLPHLPHIIGRDMNAGEFIFKNVNYELICYVKRYWTSNENSLYFFGKENYLIRAILNSKHLYEQSKMNNKTIIVSYHSCEDQGAPVQNKIDLIDACKHLGFNTTLHLIKDEKDIDGRFIKSLEHGLRMSDKALFNKELPN